MVYQASWLQPNGVPNLDSAACLQITLTRFNRTSVNSATAFFVEKNLKEVAHLSQVSPAHYVIHPVHGSMLTGHLPQGSSIDSAGMAAVVDTHLEPWRTDELQSGAVEC